MGRIVRQPPRELTEAVKEIIIRATKMGVSEVNAATLAGIHQKTYWRWKAYAKQGVEPYASFWVDIGRAEAEIEQRAVKVWTTALQDDWRAAADFLAKRFPKVWGRLRTEACAEELAADAEVAEEIAADEKPVAPIKIVRDPREHFRVLPPAPQAVAS